MALPLALASLAPARARIVAEDNWGPSASGQPIPLLTISDGRAQIDVTPQGARIVAWRVPNRNGQLGNVLVGPATAAQATGLMSVAGATMGRYANRIGRGHLEIDGETWALDINNRGNTLHGGSHGFNAQIWGMERLRDGVRFSRLSPDGEMGFPGRLNVSVTYRLTRRGRADELSIAYRATTSRPTVLNLTNHAFFDLSSGQGPGQTTAWIAASTYAPARQDTGLPTGQILSVADQPWDFRAAHAFDPATSMDAALVLDAHRRKPVAIFSDKASGRVMSVATTQPAAQLFVPVKDGKAWAFCFETQHLPDAPNQPGFATTLLRPGQVFRSVTRYAIQAPARARRRARRGRHGRA